ncbi:MAG: DUF898 family protein [Bacteroidota bacterium]
MEIQEQLPQAPVENRLNFKGDGGSLFGIYLINFLLIFVTLGIYYPWARARMLKYIYGETSFYGSRLSFHGTGREMFVGFIKAIVLFGIFYSIIIYLFLSMSEAQQNPDPENGTPIWMYFLGIYSLLILFMATIVPLAIHGALKYRLAKTSWRGIRLGYRGDRGRLYVIFIRDLLLSLITLGVYRAWFEVNLKRYIMSQVRFGDVEFRFKGDGLDLFMIHFKGIILSFLTLGIYSFWYATDIYNFNVNNIRVVQKDREFPLRSTATVSDIFELLVINWLMVTFTFGIATPWAVARQLKFYLGNALFDTGFDPNLIVQTEADYNDALAEDLSDMFDLGIV